MTNPYKGKKILWLHHYESCWEEGMQRLHGLSFDDYTDNIIDYLDNTHIDHVIITRFEDMRAGEEHYVLMRYLEEKGVSVEIQEVPYGVVEECYLEDQMARTIPSQKTVGETDPGINERIFIDNWMLALSEASEVMLAGAFDNECICDAEDILEHVRGFDGYRRIEDLIVGSGMVYEPRQELGRRRWHDDEMDCVM